MYLKTLQPDNWQIMWSFDRVVNVQVSSPSGFFVKLLILAGQSFGAKSRIKFQLKIEKIEQNVKRNEGNESKIDQNSPK